MRKKVFYGYIHNDTARKASLKKRKHGLLKKVQELSILCGVKACVIVYPPKEEEPVFWPSQIEVEQMLRKFEAIPYIEKSGKKIEQETYLKERVKKLEAQMKQLNSTNREMENKHYLHQIYRAGKTLREFPPIDLDNLKGYVEERRRAIERRRQFVYPSRAMPGQNPVPLQETLEHPPMTRETQYEVGSSSSNNSTANRQNPVSQGNAGGVVSDIYDISHLLHPDHDPIMFGVDLGDTMEMSNGNPEGINYGALLPHGNGGGGFNESGGDIAGNNWVYNMNLHGQVVEGAEHTNAAMFSHIGGSADLLYGWSQPHDDDFNVNQGLPSVSSGFNMNLWNHLDGSSSGYGYLNSIVDHQGSANLNHQGSELPIGDDINNGIGDVGHGWLPYQGLPEGINDMYGLHHGLAGDATNGHGALNFSDNNPMEVEQLNYDEPGTYYNNVGENMSEYPGNQHNWMNMV